MAQFDVFVNPIRATRAAYPFVVAMQSDLVPATTDQIIAPLAPQSTFPKGVGRRVTPSVVFQSVDHMVIVPRMVVMPLRDLAAKFGSLASARSEILAAIDLLFFGI